MEAFTEKRELPAEETAAAQESAAEPAEETAPAAAEPAVPEELMRHFVSLRRQEAELKKLFPSFDLMTEVRENPAFARMTSPGGGMSVEQAFYAIHGREIMAEGMRVATEKAAQQLSASVRANAARPAESGGREAAPVNAFDYGKLSKNERDAFKQELRQKWARGEKVYPR